MSYHLQPFLVNNSVVVYSLQDDRGDSFVYNAGSCELEPNLKVNKYVPIDGSANALFGVHPTVVQYENGNLDIVYAPNDVDHVYFSDGQSAKHNGQKIAGKSEIYLPDLSRSRIGSSKLVPARLDMPNMKSIDQFIDLSYHDLEQGFSQNYLNPPKVPSPVISLPSSQTKSGVNNTPISVTKPVVQPTPSRMSHFPEGDYRQTPSVSRSVMDRSLGYPANQPSQSVQPTPKVVSNHFPGPQPTPRGSYRPSTQPTPRGQTTRPGNTTLNFARTMNTPEIISNPSLANATMANAALTMAINDAPEVNLMISSDLEPPQVTIDMTSVPESLSVIPSPDLTVQDNNMSKRMDMGEIRSPSPQTQARPSPNPDSDAENSPNPSPGSSSGSGSGSGSSSGSVNNSESLELKELRREVSELRETLIALTRRYYQIYPVTIPAELRSEGKPGVFISVSEAKKKCTNGDFVNFTLDPLHQPFVASNRKGSINRILTFHDNNGSLYFVRAAYDPEKNEFNEPV